MTTPSSVIDFNMKTKESVIKKEQTVLGGYDKNNYETKRIWVNARDGVKVPVSLVYRKDTPINSNTPLLQYAYGSYGYSMDASFSSSRLRLLVRGFIFAIAHLRGGQAMGRDGYVDGTVVQKAKTFNDYI